MNEKELLEVLNDEFKLELKSTCEETFCRFDADNDTYMAELKCRRAHYNTQMIEYDKLDFIKTEADKTTETSCTVCQHLKVCMYLMYQTYVRRVITLTGRINIYQQQHPSVSLIVRLRR